MSTENVTLKDFMVEFGDILAERVVQKLKPVYSPTNEDEFDRETEKICSKLLRRLFPKQLSAVKALSRAIYREDARCVFLTAEMGSGKTIMAIATVLRSPRPVRTIVVCPPHLVRKWAREIRETSEDALIFDINGKDVIRRLAGLREQLKERPQKHEFYIIGRERLKQRYGWKAAFNIKKKLVRNVEGRVETTFSFHCPDCGRIIQDEKENPLFPEDLKKKRHFCTHCGSALWQADREARRHAEPASFIKKYLKGFFTFAIFDEVHELKGENTNQGKAFGSLASAVEHSICLTGTLMGGYADNIFYLLYRTTPFLLHPEFSYHGQARWTAKYGILQEVIKERQRQDSYYGRGTKRSRTLVRKPGLSPDVLPRYLLDKAIFMRLTDICNDLPSYDEYVITIEMDDELREAYHQFERDLKEAVRKALAQGSKRLLGTYLQALLSYPDRPREAITIEDPETGGIVAVAPALNIKTTQKEKVLIDIVKQEKGQGRNSLIYCIHTQTRDITEDLKERLTRENLQTFILRANSTSTTNREGFIKNKLKEDSNINMICNPEIVKTGLDLVEFPTVIFYQTGYSIYTLRQASRRTWRIGQKRPVKVYYLVYKGTMQERAMRLIASKLETSLAVEGDLTDKGLVALSEGEGSLIYELARSLVDNVRMEGSLDEEWVRYKRQETRADTELTEEVLRAKVLTETKESITVEQIGNKLLFLEVVQKGRGKRRKRRARIRVEQGKLGELKEKTGQDMFQLILPFGS